MRVERSETLIDSPVLFDLWLLALPLHLDPLNILNSVMPTLFDLKVWNPIPGVVPNQYRPRLSRK